MCIFILIFYLGRSMYTINTCVLVDPADKPTSIFDPVTLSLGIYAHCISWGQLLKYWVDRIKIGIIVVICEKAGSVVIGNFTTCSKRMVIVITISTVVCHILSFGNTFPQENLHSGHHLLFHTSYWICHTLRRACAPFLQEYAPT